MRALAGFLLIAGLILLSAPEGWCGGTVLFVLDASGSMRWSMNSCNEHGDPASPKNEIYYETQHKKEFRRSKRFPNMWAEEGTRIEAARMALEKLWHEYLQLGYRPGLLVFSSFRDVDSRNRFLADECNVMKLEVSPKELIAWKDFTARLDRVDPGYATPLAASIERAVKELEGIADGDRQIVVISDGYETCNGDPLKAVTAARAKLGLTLHIVGIDMCDKKGLQALAAAGGGSYMDNEVPDGFAESHRASQAAPPVAPPKAPAKASGARPKKEEPVGEAPVGEAPVPDAGGANEVSFGSGPSHNNEAPPAPAPLLPPVRVDPELR